jgi:DNA invertase Pin-like site-specific DNA recombinase
VFSEKVSSAQTDRGALAKAIAALGAGDTLLVCKLDRLARSTRDLLNTLAAIAEAGASFRSLGDPWCDTTSAHGKLMVTVLGGLAEFERHLILARTTEGRKRAQARGVRFGRKLKLTAHQRQEAIARREAGEALVDIARSYNVSHSTISRLGAVFTASHNHKLLPRPLNAIIDLGNTNPDRVGAHRGMGTDGSGPGSHIHENRSRFYTSDDLKIVKYLLTK